MEGVAYLLKDGRFGGKDAAVGQFQEDVLDAVSHEFLGFPFTELIPEEDPAGVLVDGKVQDSDEVDGGEIIGPFPGRHLFLDGEGRVEQGPFIEEVLMGELHLDDEAGSVDVSAFDIDTDSLVVGERVDVLLRSVFQVSDFAFWDQFFEEELEELLPPFGSEGSFEPVIEQDSRIAPGFSRCFHGFFPQTSEKEPFQKKNKRLSSKTPFQGRKGSFFKVNGNR